MRGAGNGVAIPGNSAVAVDSEGRIYAISTGACQGGQPGAGPRPAQRPDRDRDSIPLGECSIARHRDNDSAARSIHRMPATITPAIILAAFRYGETSKIVRLATREYGVQSAIAKGASRPRSRFGASLQVLSGGEASLIIHERRDLQLLTAFDPVRMRIGIARDMPRYSAAAALAEVMLRFAPAEGHPEAYHALETGLDAIETAGTDVLEAVALRALWLLVAELGFSPALDFCVRDGAPLPEGVLIFSARDGGALCASCARGIADTARLRPQDRADLTALLQNPGGPPQLDAVRSAAHRRLLGRYIRHHLSEGASLPALDFWLDRPWDQS